VTYFSNGPKGVVSEKSGPVSYKIRIDGGIIRRHVDQIVKSALHPDAPQLREEPQVDEILNDGNRPCVLRKQIQEIRLINVERFRTCDWRSLWCLWRIY
jgi:hypothetical protein